MTNTEIIFKAAISTGIYTEAEATAIMEQFGELPIHTFAEWKKAGFSVKRGEHAALVCDLWKYTSKPGKSTQAVREAAQKAGKDVDMNAPDPHYYMAKSHLFTAAQVHEIEKTA